MRRTTRSGEWFAVGAIVLGTALILTAWLPSESSAGQKGSALGNKATSNAGIRQHPNAPIKVRIPQDPVKGLGPVDPIKALGPQDPIKVMGPQDPTRVQQNR